MTSSGVSSGSFLTITTLTASPVLSSGTATAVTDSAADENPSFAPNSRLIVYATQQQGREALMTTTVDGKIKARLSGQNGDIREPDWGPYQKQ